MDLREPNNLVRETISFPVRYDHFQQTIWDSKGMMVCDIRGWGRTQSMNYSEERQDAIGEKIARLLNGAGADRDKNDDEEQKDTIRGSAAERVVRFEWD